MRQRITKPENLITIPKPSKPERYYLYWSSVFDNPDNRYDLAIFSEAIRSERGHNCRPCRQLGYSNQPLVLAFTVNNPRVDLDNIRAALSRLAPWKYQRLASPILYPVDWGKSAGRKKYEVVT